ncbi:MAG: PilN domain-containing protein [Terriglobia bacterium]
MIRINLIQTPGAGRGAKHEESGDLARRSGRHAAASALICFGLAALLYWRWSRQTADLNGKIAVARVEGARLAAVEAQNGRYQVELAQIEQHIKLTQALESSRTGPQQLMANLGDVVDGIKGLYLLSVKSNHDKLNIEGQADHVNAIADFIAVLENAHSFDDIELNRVFEDDQYGKVSFKFGLACLYKPPLETAASMPPAAPAGSSGRPPGR